MPNQGIAKGEKETGARWKGTGSAMPKNNQKTFAHDARAHAFGQHEPAQHLAMRKALRQRRSGPQPHCQHLPMQRERERERECERERDRENERERAR